MDTVLSRLADSVSGAQDLAALTRPLLELLENVTGMESTYLTAIDENQGVQHILYSRNARKMQIPEGLSVPWNDTLCKRALDENRAYTDNVADCWGDSDAARALGITTYLSQPVRNTDGDLFGTLCAASSSRVAVVPETIRVLGLFAKLISQQVERERLVMELRQANEDLSSQALIDPLTGVANRRSLIIELRRMLARAARDGVPVQVGFIDLDGFKQINDKYGHQAGDQFLKRMAEKLSGNLRAGDLVARYGGDEFVVIAQRSDLNNLREVLERLTIGQYVVGSVTLDYAGASVGMVISEPGEGDPERLLARADAAMYLVKKERKRKAGTAPRN